MTLTTTQQQYLTDMLKHAAEIAQQGDEATIAQKNAFLLNYTKLQPLFAQLRFAHNIAQINNTMKHSQAQPCNPQVAISTGCSSCGTAKVTPSVGINCSSKEVIANALSTQAKLVTEITQTITLLSEGKLKVHTIAM